MIITVIYPQERPRAISYHRVDGLDNILKDKLDVAIDQDIDHIHFAC